MRLAHNITNEVCDECAMCKHARLDEQSGHPNTIRRGPFEAGDNAALPDPKLRDIRPFLPTIARPFVQLLGQGFEVSSPAEVPEVALIIF